MSIANFSCISTSDDALATNLLLGTLQCGVGLPNRLLFQSIYQNAMNHGVAFAYREATHHHHHQNVSPPLRPLLLY